VNAAADDLINCPCCGFRSLVRHCQSTTCNWHKCRTKKCAAVLNLRKRKGHALNTEGKLHIVRLDL
jgi:hypothetical protein